MTVNQIDESEIRGSAFINPSVKIYDMEKIKLL